MNRKKQLSIRNLLKKFKPKKTTDDCYTPPLIYEAVKAWACKEYNIDSNKIVRPFYPGREGSGREGSGREGSGS